MPGFPVFGTGQPTLAGFDKVMEPIIKKYGDEKIIYWANLRQEPVVYANGKPFTARDPEKYVLEITFTYYFASHISPYYGERMNNTI